VRRTPPDLDTIRVLRGLRLRDARQARGYSQDQVAVAVGVTKAAISLWENGRTDISTKNQIAIADTLGVAWSDLFTGSEVP
jgi:transcriptional regulator with XRE-family HTH domain